MKGHTQEIVDQDQEIVYRNQKKKNIETEERGRDRKIGGNTDIHLRIMI